jgi:hypothetical protein
MVPARALEGGKEEVQAVRTEIAFGFVGRGSTMHAVPPMGLPWTAVASTSTATKEIRCVWCVERALTHF